MNEIELLAPAGDMDSLVAAVENGADAVYFGGKYFNARQYAGNFDDDEIKAAVEYCHIRGVRVFITLNILLKDKELSMLPGYLSFLYNTGVDALIVQDLGAGHLIRQVLPMFELHASTQMTAHNLEAVDFLYNEGYKRVVLSRELSLDEISHITENSGAEIEIFTHGALCICYSGQCLMSSMIGGRSGNRGRCAQPCRMKYTLNMGEGVQQGYVMSPKDLNTIDYIGPIMDTGIKSLKVEGRMKKPEYVAAVISTYRKAIDSYLRSGRMEITDEDRMTLLKAFNRGGFTTAHMFNRGREDMMSKERPKNWGTRLGRVADVFHGRGLIEILLEDDGLSIGDGIEIWTKAGDNVGYTVESMEFGGKSAGRASRGSSVLLAYKGGMKNDVVYKTYDIENTRRLQETYNISRPLRKIPINIDMSIKRGRPCQIRIGDGDGNSVVAEGPPPEEAVKVQLSQDRVTEQVQKLGNTPYRAASLDIELDKGLSLPAAVLNNLRRSAVDELTKSRLQKYKRTEIPYEHAASGLNEVLSAKRRKSPGRVRISVFTGSTSNVQSAIDGGADIIIIGGDRLRGSHADYHEAIERCVDAGVEIYIASPRIMKQEFNDVMDGIERCLDHGLNGIYAENLGALNAAAKRSIAFSSGFSLNIFNYLSASMLKGMGSRNICLSHELSLKDIGNIAPYVENCEALCYGRIEMMVSEYCPAGSVGGCSKINGRPACEVNEISLKDRLGMVFPIKTDICCRSHIYNSKVLSMLENLQDVISCGVDIIRLNMVFEDDRDVLNIVGAFKQRLQMLEKGIYHIPDSIAHVIEGIAAAGYTKGHYYRGVE